MHIKKAVKSDFKNPAPYNRTEQNNVDNSTLFLVFEKIQKNGGG
jgi:hypothetical protein